MGIVYQRAPVSEFAPFYGCALGRQNGSRAAASVPCALARAGKDDCINLALESIVQGMGSDGRECCYSPLARRVLRLHSWLVRSLPAHPRHCKVAAFRCSPLRSLFRGDGMGWSNGWRATRVGTAQREEGMSHQHIGRLAPRYGEGRRYGAQTSRSGTRSQRPPTSSHSVVSVIVERCS
jgi:hypothetical protein